MRQKGSGTVQRNFTGEQKHYRYDDDIPSYTSCTDTYDDALRRRCEAPSGTAGPSLAYLLGAVRQCMLSLALSSKLSDEPRGVRRRAFEDVLGVGMAYQLFEVHMRRARVCVGYMRSA